MRPGPARARASGEAGHLDRHFARPCRSSRARPCRRANARTARRLRTRPASSSRWRSNGSTAFAAMVSSSGPTNRAARTCSCTWRRCASRILPELQPGQKLEARIAPSGKGLTAVELRELGELGLAAGAARADRAAARRRRRSNAPAETVDARAQTGLREVPLTIRSTNGDPPFHGRGRGNSASSRSAG